MKDHRKCCNLFLLAERRQTWMLRSQQYCNLKSRRYIVRQACRFRQQNLRRKWSCPLRKRLQGIVHLVWWRLRRKCDLRSRRLFAFVGISLRLMVGMINKT